LAFTGGVGMRSSLSRILFSQPTKTVQIPFGTTSDIKTCNSARWTVFCVSTGIALKAFRLTLVQKKIQKSCKNRKWRNNELFPSLLQSEII